MEMELEQQVVEQPQLNYAIVVQLSTVSSIGVMLESLESLEKFKGDQQLARVLNKRNDRKYTWLHTAILSNVPELVKLCIEFGADTTLKCHGTPCLHLALTVFGLPEGDSLGEDTIQMLLENSDTSARDDQGASVAHIAAELNLVFALSALERLEKKSLFESKDRLGQRPLHRAATTNSIDAVKYLISQEVDLNAQAHNGLTALHLAAEAGNEEVWALLVAASANATSLPDKWGRTAVEHASYHGWAFNASDGSISAAHDTSVANKTVIITHPLCRKHATCRPSLAGSPQSPPENTHRLSVIIDQEGGSLRSQELAHRLSWIEECKPATIGDVLRVHEWTYIRHLQHTCDDISPNPESSDGLGRLDGDTTISRDSFAAALHGAGAVCQGVDKVMRQEARNAFAAVRPPGHHSGPRGPVKTGGYGFCLLNNISIAAAYALNMYRDTIKRVAIVDFDVHHGNGTEETVRWLQPGVETEEVSSPQFFGSLHTALYKPWFGVDDPANVLFVSVHGYGARERGMEHLFPRACFYPGSGPTTLPSLDQLDAHHKSDVGTSDARKGIPLPGSDSEDSEESEDGENEEEAVNAQVVAMAAVPANDDDDDDDDEDDEDYDGSGGDEDGDSDAAPQPSSESDGNKIDSLMTMYSNPLSRYDSSGCDSSHSMHSMPALILDIGVGLPPLAEDELTDVGTAYRYQWRSYFRDEVFPRLMQFQPDMIFISAGFDAHRKDGLNGGYIALVEEDFEWITSALVKIANSCCDGRIVSALEGGYQIGGEHCSSFAKSVKAHVQALAKGGNSRGEYVPSDAAKEVEMEKEWLDEAAARKLARYTPASMLDEMASSAPITAPVADAAQDAAIPAAAEEGSESPKKRRRPQVDYAALDEKLRATAPDAV